MHSVGNQLSKRKAAVDSFTQLELIQLLNKTILLFLKKKAVESHPVKAWNKRECQRCIFTYFFIYVLDVYNPSIVGNAKINDELHFFISQEKLWIETE